MRLPAVAIAAAFGSGILLGLHPVVARNAASSLLISVYFAAIAILILTVIALVRIGRLFFAVVASLHNWAKLGFMGDCVAEQPRNAVYVISLMDRGHLPLLTPVWWHVHM